MSSLVYYSCCTLSGWWCIAGLWQLLSGQQQKQLESNRIVTTTSWKLAQVKCLLIQKPKKETREWPRSGPVPVAVPRSAFLDRRLPSGTFVPQFVWTSGERRYRPGGEEKRDYRHERMNMHRCRRITRARYRAQRTSTRSHWRPTFDLLL